MASLAVSADMAGRTAMTPNNVGKKIKMHRYMLDVERQRQLLLCLLTLKCSGRTEFGARTVLVAPSWECSLQSVASYRMGYCRAGR